MSFIEPTAETVCNETLKKQAHEKGLYNFNRVVVLGGKHYVERATAIFNNGQSIELPLKDCKGIGYMIQRLTRSINESNEVNILSTRKYKKVKKVKRENNYPSSMGKYTPLFEYLDKQDRNSLILSIKQIEDVLGFVLPKSAHEHRAWWANDLSHSQAKAWLMAGWKVESVDLNHTVRFRNANQL